MYDWPLGTVTEPVIGRPCVAVVMKVGCMVTVDTEEAHELSTCERDKNKSEAIIRRRMFFGWFIEMFCIII